MNNSEKQLSDRLFGFVISLIICFFSLIPFFFDKDIFFYGFYFAALLSIITITRPVLLNPIKLIWIRFGEIISKIISFLILISIYIFMIIPTGLLLKLFRKDILDLKVNKNNKSYWKYRKNYNSSMKDQF